MFQSIHVRRIAAATIVGVMALGAFAPVADAGGRGNGNGKKWKSKDQGSRSESRSYDRGSSRRYKDRYVVRDRHSSRDRYRHRQGRGRVVIRERGSDLGPALVGFVGGLIVGHAVSNHGHAAPPRYAYYDPYCERSYATLHAGAGHFRGCDHPRLVRQVEVRTQRVVKTYEYDNGRWLDYHDDYAYDGGYYDE